MRAALELIASGRIDPRRSSRTGCRSRRPAEALELQRRGEALKAVVLP